MFSNILLVSKVELSNHFSTQKGVLLKNAPFKILAVTVVQCDVFTENNLQRLDNQTIEKEIILINKIKEHVKLKN